MILYEESANEVRSEIERIFQSKEYILNYLISFPSYASGFIDSSADVEWLRMGLTAALIVDRRGDFRELFVSLGILYVRALEKGIDPVPYFHETVSHSMNTRQNVLDEFLQSEYLDSIIKAT